MLKRNAALLPSLMNYFSFAILSAFAELRKSTLFYGAEAPSAGLANLFEGA
jgi:hypothetical protein